eukprot:197754-Chlamydomonas_euryale.AAC.1
MADRPKSAPANRVVRVTLGSRWLLATSCSRGAWRFRAGGRAGARLATLPMGCSMSTCAQQNTIAKDAQRRGPVAFDILGESTEGKVRCWGWRSFQDLFPPFVEMPPLRVHASNPHQCFLKRSSLARKYASCRVGRSLTALRMQPAHAG